MPLFFMAATLTTPPAAAVNIPDPVIVNPLDFQPVVTLAAGLKAGTVGARPTDTDGPGTEIKVNLYGNKAPTPPAGSGTGHGTGTGTGHP